MTDPAPSFNRAVADDRAGDRRRARAGYQRALAADPAYVPALNNLAILNRHEGREGEALALLRRALAAAPDSGDVRSNLAVQHERLGDWTAAEAHHRAATARPDRSPNSRYNLGQFLLRTGRHAQAWEELEQRPNNRSFHQNPRFPADLPVWDGEPLPGRTLVVYAEGGFGDLMLFSRWLPHAAALCGAVTVVGQPRLGWLPEGLPCPAGRIVTHVNGLPPFGGRLLLLSLPHALRRHLAGLPPAPPLTAPAEPARAWAERLAPHRGPRVGLFWRTGDARKSVPLATLLRLTRAYPATYVSLEPAPTGEERRLLAQAGVLHFDEQAADAGAFRETAGLLSALDVTVTIDSAVANLAGALGRPACVLLHHVGDARWGSELTPPWYASTRVVRQTRPGDWDSVVVAAGATLEGVSGVIVPA